MMTDCIFCKIADKQIPASVVYEDDEMLCFKDIRPAAPVHLLLIPKEHFDSLAHAGPQHEALLVCATGLKPKSIPAAAAVRKCSASMCISWVRRFEYQAV